MYPQKAQGRKLTFALSADDGIDAISRGTHERFVIDATKFNQKVSAQSLRTPPN